LVIERFVDDGADYRFVPDRSTDTGVRAEMSLLVALGPGCRSAPPGGHAATGAAPAGSGGHPHPGVPVQSRLGSGPAKSR